GLPAKAPSRRQSTTRMSHLSASYPAFFCALHASLLPSGLNRGLASAAGLSFLSGSPSRRRVSVATRPRAWLVLQASASAGTAVKTRCEPSGENVKSSPTLKVVEVG